MFTFQWHHCINFGDRLSKMEEAIWWIIKLNIHDCGFSFVVFLYTASYLITSNFKPVVLFSASKVNA